MIEDVPLTDSPERQVEQPRGRAAGLVMLCDVDLDCPDATRTHTVEVARAFANEGLAVDLVARGPDPGLPGVSYASAAGAEHEKLRRLLTINRQTVARLWRRRRSADRFYVRDNWSCLPSILAARLLSYRVVVQVDGIPYGPGFEDSPAANLVKRVVAIVTGRLSQGQLAVTPQIKQLLVELARVPEDRVAVIPNGVDLDFFSPLPREEAVARLGLDPDRRYVVFCGGLHRWTDFPGIVRAFADARSDHPELALILVGDGEGRSQVESTARELGVADDVQITGMLHDRRRVRDYLAAATITLLGYRGDDVGRTSASPIKLTEYMAMARAVVAYEIPGIHELIEETGAGLVVNGDPAAMAAAIRQLLADGTADRYGAAGRAVAEARLSWRSVIHRAMALFDQ